MAEKVKTTGVSKESGYLYYLDKGGNELVNYFKDINFSENDFRNMKVNRLKKLENLIHEKKINNRLEWI